MNRRKDETFFVRRLLVRCLRSEAELQVEFYCCDYQGEGSDEHQGLLPGLEDVGGEGDGVCFCAGGFGRAVAVLVGEVDGHGVYGGGGGDDVGLEPDVLMETGG